MAMRGITAAALAVMLMGSVVPAVAQQGAAKPATESVKTGSGKAEAKIGPRTVTGTVKATTDKGFVVVGRETGQKDKEWAFALDGATRVDAVGKARTAKDLREGDPVTVTYTNRDGKIVAQSVTVNAK
jgi:hypothetical protein